MLTTVHGYSINNGDKGNLFFIGLLPLQFIGVLRLSEDRLIRLQHTCKPLSRISWSFFHDWWLFNIWLHYLLHRLWHCISATTCTRLALLTYDCLALCTKVVIIGCNWLERASSWLKALLLRISCLWVSLLRHHTELVLHHGLLHWHIRLPTHLLIWNTSSHTHCIDFRDESSKVLHMLNSFAHHYRIYLSSQSILIALDGVRGEHGKHTRHCIIDGLLKVTPAVSRDHTFTNIERNKVAYCTHNLIDKLWVSSYAVSDVHSCCVVAVVLACLNNNISDVLNIRHQVRMNLHFWFSLKHFVFNRLLHHLR